MPTLTPDRESSPDIFSSPDAPCISRADQAPVKTPRKKLKTVGQGAESSPASVVKSTPATTTTTTASSMTPVNSIVTSVPSPLSSLRPATHSSFPRPRPHTFTYPPTAQPKIPRSATIPAPEKRFDPEIYDFLEDPLKPRVKKGDIWGDEEYKEPGKGKGKVVVTYKGRKK
ncbi:hypothetical protein K440DRAFT_642196 [Wilcoxina mikolae CBS 423.85]|nr:hypothetical protein K440DRAFT_681657 [Wilcoxina mikolae CBS 423.85]KAF8241500.1 hypothetical protein K440DRAFT_642196 [Wilcoxina mikolae CBS 423.85]